MTYLILSAILVNGFHIYLLWTQRDHRQPTISEHAVKDAITERLYAAVHVLNGFLMIIFSWQIFHDEYNLILPLILAYAAVLFEWIQAIVPYKGKFSAVHYYGAYAMFVSSIILCIAIPFVLPLIPEIRTILMLLSTVPVISFIYFLVMYKRNRRYFWIFQMASIFVVYCELFLILR